MNKEEIRDKISSIVWHINSNYSPSGAETTIMEIIEKVQEDAYQEGFKAAGIYTNAWHNDTYQISFYGVETNDDFKVIVTATVYDTEELKLRYPDVAGNILKISDAGEMEVAFNDKELEIIKTDFDKTVAEYKRCKEEKIKGELEYIRNPNRYINVYNSYRDKSIAYPLAEYLDIKASQSGFEDYEDMLNEGLSIDYSGEYLK